MIQPSNPHYSASDRKAAEAYRCSQIMRARISPPRAAYVHVPFCISKCHYCDFNSYPGMDSFFKDYVDAVVAEIERVRPVETPLDSVYVGGGTPTLLSSEQLSSIIAALDRAIGIAAAAEITVEANPGTVDESKPAELRASRGEGHRGFNRLSLGVQSFDDGFLAAMGRAHTAAQAVEAYRAARNAGFTNVGIDLMFGLPGQTVGHWERTLERALGLSPEHISLYELTVEEGTRFAALCARGEVETPDDETLLEMYELAIRALTDSGYEHYEVSNFARPGFRCRHNQVYWRNEPYYGFGAGATSYVHGARTRRIADPRDYASAIMVGSDAIEFSERLEGRARLAETIIQGLRMMDGIELMDAAREFETEIDALTTRGLLETAGSRLRVTHSGLLVLNDVAREFVSEP